MENYAIINANTENVKTSGVLMSESNGAQENVKSDEKQSIDKIPETNISDIGFTITEKTKLGELIKMLQLGEKPSKTPTPRKLKMTAGVPIIQTDNFTVYRNGFVVYSSSGGVTTFWLPDCADFTYYFDRPTKEERGVIHDKYQLPKGLLSEQGWEVAVTLIAEHRIEANLMNRTGSRKGTKDYESEDDGDKNGDAEDAVEKSLKEEYFWAEDRIDETPESIYIRNETRREMLDRMSEKQRKVFVLYYYNGYTQSEIAEIFGIAQKNVNKLLEKAIKKIKTEIFC